MLAAVMAVVLVVMVRLLLILCSEACAVPGTRNSARQQR